MEGDAAVLDAPVDPGLAPATTPATPSVAAASEAIPEVVLDLGISKPEAPKELSDEEIEKLSDKDARTHAKGWKKSANTYKDSHDAVQSFGGVNNLKSLKGVHDSFIAPKLDPQQFFGELSKIDPQRAAELMTFAGSKVAGNSKEAILTEIFGSVPTKQDVELFRQFKAADGKLVSVPGGQPVPERFLYSDAEDDDGNVVKTLKSQKEIDANPDYQTWKELQRQRQEFSERTERETREKTRTEQQRVSQEREGLIKQNIEKWLEPVDLALKQLGYTPDPSDTPEVAEQKQLLAMIFEGVVLKTFENDETSARLFYGSQEYIRNGRPDLLDTIDAHTRIRGIVADRVYKTWELIKGGVRARAKATQASVTQQPAPNPVVAGASNGLQSTKVVAPADITTNPASTAKFMNDVLQETLQRRGIQQNG